MSESVVSSESAPVEESSVEESGVESVEASSEGGIEASGDLQEAVEEAIAEGASPQEVKNMIRKFQLKVNGKTVEREIDLSDEKGLQKELQMAAAGREAMQSKAEYEKAIKTLVERLKSDPLALAEELGIDADEMAASRLRRKIEEAKKSPEQVAFEKMQREIEEYRRREQEREAQISQSEQHRIQEEAMRELQDEIDTALNAYTTLPKGSPIVMDLIAKNLNWAMDNHEKFGFDTPEDVRVEHILPAVEADLTRHMNKFFEEVPLDMINKFIGKKASENMRQKRISSAKKTNNINNIKKTTESNKPKEEKPKEKGSLNDFMRTAY